MICNQCREFFFVDLDVDAEGVAERHLAYCLGKASEAEGIGRDYIAGGYLVFDEFEVGLELVCIRHMIGQRRMSDQVQAVAFPLQFRRDDFSGIYRGDSECHKHRRDIYVFERSAHGILPAYRRKTQSHLHFQGSEKGSEGFAP